MGHSFHITKIQKIYDIRKNYFPQLHNSPTPPISSYTFAPPIHLTLFPHPSPPHPAFIPPAINLRPLLPTPEQFLWLNSHTPPPLIECRDSVATVFRQHIFNHLQLNSMLGEGIWVYCILITLPRLLLEVAECLTRLSCKRLKYYELSNSQIGHIRGKAILLCGTGHNNSFGP